MTDGERRYTDQEFALILRKAAEPRERASAPVEGEGGLTLAEITAIAREVGLDPAQVARAAAELEMPPVTRLSRILGGDPRPRLEVRVPRPLPAEAHPRVVEAIREATRHHGEVHESLGGLEWRGGSGETRLFVTITPGPVETRVVLAADRSPAQTVLWVLTTVGSLFAVGVTGSIVEPGTVAGGVGLAAGILGAGFVTARAIWSSATRRFQARMHAILERVAREVTAPNA